MISVIIPTYNRADRVGEAIRSVVNQTDQNWELIIVDDGSTDRTHDHVQRILDRRIRYIHQGHAGVSAARNRGIAASRGAFIALLDSDDRWDPRKLEIQRAFFDAHPAVAVCQTEELWIRNGARVNPRAKHAKPSGWIFPRCVPLCVVSPSAVMLRRSVFETVGCFDEALPACEDYDLWLRVSLVYRIVTLRQPLTVKIGGHEDQLSRRWGLDRYRIEALEKLLMNAALPDRYRPLVKREIARRANIVALGAEKRGNGVMAAAYRRKTVTRDT